MEIQNQAAVVVVAGDSLWASVAACLHSGQNQIPCLSGGIPINKHEQSNDVLKCIANMITTVK